MRGMAVKMFFGSERTSANKILDYIDRIRSGNGYFNRSTIIIDYIYLFSVDIFGGIINFYKEIGWNGSKFLS